MFEQNVITILKFGGASVANAQRIKNAAHIIKNRVSVSKKVLVVASAMGQTTDELVHLAKGLHASPPEREMDMLVSTGERVTIALLAIALDHLGVRAKSFTGSQSGIITTNNHSHAEILEVRPQRIFDAFKEHDVVICAGFQGMSLEKEITTLGRGGSDTTAVAMAAALGVDRVTFFKDVRGVGRQDPHLFPNTEIFSQLNYDEALEIVGPGADLLHERAVEMAKKHEIALEIRFFKTPEEVGTIVGLTFAQNPPY